MSSVFDQIIKKRRSVRVFLDKNLDDIVRGRLD